MADVSIRKRVFQKTLKSLNTSQNDTRISKRLSLLYLIISLLSVPARSGKRQHRARGPSPPQLPRKRRDLQDPASRRADFCRRVRHLIAKIRHQKNTVLTQDSSEICTDRTLETRTETMASLPPQETWTNSWTCWTSGILEEKDQSLDWDLTPISTTTSNTSLRLDQKPSGPFDNDLNSMVTDYGALHNLKEMNQESISFEDMGLSQILDMDMPADAAMSEDEFLNSFMDLSEFLLPEQPIEETEEVKNVIKLDEDFDVFSALVEPVPQEAIICEEVESPTVSLKREFDDVDMKKDDFDWSLNMDHDYVTKKPRLSPAPVVVESTKTPSSKSKQSTSKSTANKLPPDLKYRERRVKNNIASRRSREIRKMKFSEMDEEANRLVVVNSELRVKIEEMEKLAKDMKALLVQKLAAK